jgi:hypothetical protein
MSALFHSPATPVVPFSSTPRRGIRVMNAQNVSPVSSTVQNTAPVYEASVPASVVDREPLTATPPRAEKFTNAPHPIAASSLLGTDYMRQIDNTYTGIKLDSEPSRIVQSTPENMNRMRRVLDRTEVDPYTGKKVDFYKQLPPEENKDYRLPRETMNEINRRLISIQGYDHTKPKPQRTERMADAPQPDGRFDEAANYMRIVNEMRERVARDMVNNQKGERPAWMRETQRAFGYNGYQDMSRYVPDLPPTMRADTEHLTPASDQVNNPSPKKELLVRGAYRDDAKTPHTGQVDWRNHAKSVDTDAHVYTSGVEQRVQDGTYRGDHEDQGFQPGPKTASTDMAPQFGESHESRRKELPVTNFALRATSNLTQVGAAASDAMADRVLTKILDSVGRQNANNSDFVSHATRGVMYPQAMQLNSSTANTDGSSTIRPEYSVNTFLTYANSRDSGVIKPPVLNIDLDDRTEIKRNSMPTMQFASHGVTSVGTTLPPVILGSSSDHQDRKRNDFPENQFHSYASSGTQDINRATKISATTDLADRKRVDQLNVIGLQMAPSDAPFAEPTWISTKSDKLDTKRFFDKTEFFDKAVMAVAGPNIRDGIFEQEGLKSQAYGADAGSRRNAASATDLGTLQIGQQEILKVSGKRELTGQVSATTYLHGGGIGMAFQSPGMFNRESFLPENDSNRTYVQDFSALSQAANRTTQPM